MGCMCLFSTWFWEKMCVWYITLPRAGFTPISEGLHAGFNASVLKFSLLFEWAVWIWFCPGPCRWCPDVDVDHPRSSFVLLGSVKPRGPELVAVPSLSPQVWGGLLQRTENNWKLPGTMLGLCLRPPEDGGGGYGLCSLPLPHSDLQRECIYKHAFIERRRGFPSCTHNLHKTMLYCWPCPHRCWMVKSFHLGPPFLGRGSRRKRRVYLSGGATSDGSSAKRPLSNLAIVFKGGQP